LSVFEVFPLLETGLVVGASAVVLQDVEGLSGATSSRKRSSSKRSKKAKRQSPSSWRGAMDFSFDLPPMEFGF
jgi:hypothetical protein